MKFKIGHTKRPKYIDDGNVVIFEHITEKGKTLAETTPTQEECEDYGFHYNKETNKCTCKSTSKYDYRKGRNFGTNSIDAYVGDDRNKNNIHIAGHRNIAKKVHSVSISGTDGKIDEFCNNSIVSGTRGHATIRNHYVHGGSQDTDILGERQYTRVLFGVKTTNGATNDSYINNDGINFYPIPENSIMYFNVSVVAVRVGGTGTGSLGDYASWLERGVVINQAGTLAIKRTRKAISSEGNHTNWRPTAAIDGTNFKVTCRGATDVDVEWTMTVDFTEFRASVALS